MKRALLIGRLTAISALAATCTMQSGLTAKTSGVMHIDRDDGTGHLGNSGGSGHLKSSTDNVISDLAVESASADIANVEQPAAHRRC